jgi:pyruvate dehydrogenase complex dehydrogenase (E1) component
MPRRCSTPSSTCSATRAARNSSASAAYGGAQSYPSRTKDTDDVDFSTGSVGLGVAITAFASLVQDYIRARNSDATPEGRMIALVGDAELDEGNIYECLQEGWKHGLRNCWWVIDYNRQSLDGVVREGLSSRIERDLRGLRLAGDHPEVRRAAAGRLRRAGRRRLRDWIDACPNPLYSALTYQGGAAWRVAADERDRRPGRGGRAARPPLDAELAALMENLGGHCHRSIAEAFDAPRPTTGRRRSSPTRSRAGALPLAGHKDNHAGLMTPDQMAAFQAQMRAGRAMNGNHRRSCVRRDARLPRRRSLQRPRVRPHDAPHRCPPAAPTGRPPRTELDPGSLRPHHGRAGPRRQRARRPHRHHLARRHRLDQSRPLGEPPRPVQPP